jgi:hypothetical protein
LEGRPIHARVQLGHQLFNIKPYERHEIEHGGHGIDVRRWVNLINDKAIEFAEILLAKRWSIVFIDEPLFVTSDYPLYVASPENERHQLAGIAAIIMSPLRPTRMLCFDDLDAPANRYFKVPNEAADLYNLLTWVNTVVFFMFNNENCVSSPTILR